MTKELAKKNPESMNKDCILSAIAIAIVSDET